MHTMLYTSGIPAPVAIVADIMLKYFPFAIIPKPKRECMDVV